jgi:hypothetical protein
MPVSSFSAWYFIKGWPACLYLSVLILNQDDTTAGFRFFLYSSIFIGDMQERLFLFEASASNKINLNFYFKKVATELST